MNRKAFTLLELLIVILIIAIIATLALPQYINFIERNRAAEAIRVFAGIKADQLRYHLVHGTFAETLDQLDIECPTSDYWRYNIMTGDENLFGLQASRLAKDCPPYLINTDVQMYYRLDGTTIWSGSHAGVPLADRN